MPARLEPYCLVFDLSLSVTPRQLNFQRSVCAYLAQSKMKIRAAFAGVSAAAIHLAKEFAPARKLNAHAGAEGWSAVKIGGRMPLPHLKCRRSTFDRQQKVQAQKRACVRAFILVKIG